MAVSKRETISLDGEWKIRFDESNQGVHERWYLQDERAQHHLWKLISVPSCWEELKENYEGVAWYTRTFVLEEGQKDRYAELAFDAVNYRDYFYDLTNDSTPVSPSNRRST